MIIIILKRLSTDSFKHTGIGRPGVSCESFATVLQHMARMVNLLFLIFKKVIGTDLDRFPLMMCFLVAQTHN